MDLQHLHHKMFVFTVSTFPIIHCSRAKVPDILALTSQLLQWRCFKVEFVLREGERAAKSQLVQRMFDTSLSVKLIMMR